MLMSKKRVYFAAKHYQMAIAGYSGTPLLKKLGITAAMKLLLINPHADYYYLLETDLSEQLCKKNEVPDFIHLFITTVKEFETEMKKQKAVIRKNTAIIIWISWYKKASKIETDVTEDVIRSYALKNDLVDVKVCAVSDVWSGLKLVVPLNKR